MEKSYYLKNLIIGLGLFSICAFASKSDANAVIFFLICGINAFLFPFAKRLVEDLVFRYTSKDFWRSGPLRTGAANGGYALLYGFYFALAVPLSLLFLIVFYIKKKSAI
ncbi:colicin E1 family microcin immunity protein [Pseudomonas rhodesiae]|uniref:colicin E1 family microcin immunity protein n=1 Tax=Pseudomonas rhodesiae TaxID=76760 RepID=UPI00058CCBA0|nr:colicin E1 family microcin immunity protein [Pseudomonas rhodesiae]